LVRVALLVYGVMAPILVKVADRWLSGIGGVGWRHVAFALVALGAVHSFAWVWYRHAVMLRKQYYRTMARVYAVQVVLDGTDAILYPWSDPAASLRSGTNTRLDLAKPGSRSGS